jgi:hypothetical protein
LAPTSGPGLAGGPRVTVREREVEGVFLARKKLKTKIEKKEKDFSRKRLFNVN